MITVIFYIALAVCVINIIITTKQGRALTHTISSFLASSAWIVLAAYWLSLGLSQSILNSILFALCILSSWSAYKYARSNLELLISPER